MYKHKEIRVSSTYSPWLEDDHFRQVYKKIVKHTMVDMYRCYDLWSLVEQSKKLHGALLEVGVWRGGTGAIIATKAKECGIKSPVYLCDTFEGVVKTSSIDLDHKDGWHSNTSVEIVSELLEKMGIDQNSLGFKPRPLGLDFLKNLGTLGCS